MTETNKYKTLRFAHVCKIIKQSSRYGFEQGHTNDWRNRAIKPQFRSSVHRSKNKTSCPQFPQIRVQSTETLNSKNGDCFKLQFRRWWGPKFKLQGDVLPWNPSKFEDYHQWEKQEHRKTFLWMFTLEGNCKLICEICENLYFQIRI